MSPTIDPGIMISQKYALAGVGIGPQGEGEREERTDRPANQDPKWQADELPGDPADEESRHQPLPHRTDHDGHDLGRHLRRRDQGREPVEGTQNAAEDQTEKGFIHRRKPPCMGGDAREASGYA